MPRTRVVQFIPNLTVGGAEQMMVSLAAGLKRDGFDVKVLSFFDPTGVPVERTLEASGIEVVSLGKELGFDRRMFTRVAGALQRLAPDILHTHRPVFPYAIPTVLRGLASRTVHTVHSVAQREAAGRARRASHWLAYCAGVSPVAICDYVARSIVDVYGIPPRATIPNGIPVARFTASSGVRERWRAEHGIAPDAVVFTTVARMARPKRPDDIVEAFAQLRDPGRSAVLLVVGDGPLRAEVEQRTAALGLGDRVLYTGMRDDVAEVLAASDVFVLASSFEGSPLSVMEAMAAGKPVVATAVGGIPELVATGANGLLVQPGDVGALARAMQQLLDDRDARERSGRRARAHAVESFDVSRMIGSYERLYEEVLEGRGAGHRVGPAPRRRVPERRRPRIVQFIPNLPVGGAERMMVSLAKGLDRDRYDVRVLTMFHEPDSTMAQELHEAGIELVTLGKHVGFDRRMYTRVPFALRALRPDVLHTHRAVFPYAVHAVAAMRRLRGRVVHTVHNVAEHEVGDPVRRSAHWLAFHSGVAAVAICDAAARTIVETYGVEPRATIPNGIDVRRFALPPSEGPAWRARNGVAADAIVFTLAARLAAQKDPVALVEAFAPLAKDPRALLLLVGDGELRQAVVARARTLGIEGRVRLAGIRQDVPEILAASDAFVLSSRYEGHPLCVMEAMAAGLPVVATAVGGVPELVEDGETGLVVAPGDVRALGAAMRSLVEHPDLRARMGASARRLALKQFDVSRMVQQYDRLYREILESLPIEGADSALIA